MCDVMRHSTDISDVALFYLHAVVFKETHFPSISGYIFTPRNSIINRSIQRKIRNLHTLTAYRCISAFFFLLASANS